MIEKTIHAGKQMTDVGDGKEEEKAVLFVEIGQDHLFQAISDSDTSTALGIVVISKSLTVGRKFIEK